MKLATLAEDENGPLDSIPRPSEVLENAKDLDRSFGSEGIAERARAILELLVERFGDRWVGFEESRLQEFLESKHGADSQIAKWPLNNLWGDIFLNDEPREAFIVKHGACLYVTNIFLEQCLKYKIALEEVPISTS